MRFKVSVTPQEILGLEEQLEKKGVKCELDIKKFKSIEDVPGERYDLEGDVPEHLRGKSPSEVKKEFGSYFRGLTVCEGLAVVSRHSEILEDQSIDLLGSIYGKECVPTIYRWEGTTILSAICPDISDKMCGAAKAEKVVEK